MTTDSAAASRTGNRKLFLFSLYTGRAGSISWCLLTLQNKIKIFARRPISQSWQFRSNFPILAVQTPCLRWGLSFLGTPLPKGFSGVSQHPCFCLVLWDQEQLVPEGAEGCSTVRGTAQHRQQARSSPTYPPEHSTKQLVASHHGPTHHTHGFLQGPCSSHKVWPCLHFGCISHCSQ